MKNLNCGDVSLIISSGKTNVGLVRERNEDSLSVEDSLGLYIVADGMGGHQAGDVASRVAVEMINKSFRRWAKEEVIVDKVFGYPDHSLTRTGNYVLGSIRLANRVVYELATENEKYYGMGTTIAVLAVTPTLVIAANVGDSRIYMVRNGQIEQLSKDHTVVAEQIEMGMLTAEEASSTHLKHVLTKNLGSTEDVDADVFEVESGNNDRFILCSDGLTDLVSEREILEKSQEEDNPRKLCNQLIAKALERGGHDNTSVVSVFFTDEKGQRPGPLKKARLFLVNGLLTTRKAKKKP
jgi:serine/threonine protein phosphatase PrpC